MDVLSPLELVDLINGEDRTLAEAVGSQRLPIARAIELAVEFCRTGEAAAMVTNPIHKATLTGAGFPHPGHTEFLGALAGVLALIMGILVFGYQASGSLISMQMVIAALVLVILVVFLFLKFR